MAQERSGAQSAGNATASVRAAFRAREETRAPPVFGKEKAAGSLARRARIQTRISGIFIFALARDSFG